MKGPRALKIVMEVRVSKDQVGDGRVAVRMSITNDFANPAVLGTAGELTLIR